MTLNKRLRGAAKRLLERLETWIDPSDPDKRPSLSKMRAVWTSYVTTFEQWLSNDKDQLLSSTIAYYQELQQIKRSLQRKTPDVMEKNETCAQIDVQLEQLEQKIISLGGTAAISQILESTQPSENESQQNGAPMQPNNEQTLNALNETAAPSAMGLTNEQLAHELILDPNFKLQRHPSQHPIAHQVSDIATTAFFDKVAQDIEAGSASECLPPLLCEIREVSYNSS